MTTATLLRPDTPAPEGFGFLDSCHQELVVRLQDLKTLAHTLVTEGSTAETRRQAKALQDWFNATARHHHLDEERHVFPALLSSQNPELVQATERLIQDHGWLEADWCEIEPSLSAAAAGQGWFDPLVLNHAIDVFTQLYLDHMNLEESLAYPEARQRIPLSERERMGRDMAARRAAREAQAA